MTPRRRLILKMPSKPANKSESMNRVKPNRKRRNRARVTPQERRRTFKPPPLRYSDIPEYKRRGGIMTDRRVVRR